MMRRKIHWLASLGLFGALLSPAFAANHGFKTGTPEIKSAGALAFGPDGVLFVADPKSATVFAIDTEDSKTPGREVAPVNVENIDQKIAAALGTKADNVMINDMAVNPATGNVFLSVSRGRGPQAMPAVLRVGADGRISDVALQDVRFSQVKIPNAPEDKVVGEGRRRSNPRQESITDLAFLDGRVIIAGLSNEEFASTLRAVYFPFAEADSGTSVEIFHGAHGKFETRSPVRTFVPFSIDGKPHLLAAYTCTPLVKFPLSDLKAGQKVRGETVAELGNRNRPLDMFVYEQSGETYVLMANSARGVMKIKTAGVDDIDAIEERINGTAGLSYETIEDWKGIVQLDRLGESHAVVIQETEDGKKHLKSMELP